MKKNPAFIITQCLILLSFLASAEKTLISTDQQALLLLKEHLLNPSNDGNYILAKNWTSNTSVCSWAGITCGTDSRHHRVIAMELSGFGLTGSIPGQIIGNLSSLRTLDLMYNQFSGSIPKEIGNLTKLELLYLRYNKLQGEIPEELGNLGKLEVLLLNNNLLTGSIPASIFNLSSISSGIDLSNNSLTGNFPVDDICRGLPRIEGLYMSYNQFTGPIPSNLWRSCKELAEFSASGNRFTGHIPRDLGNLTSLRTLIFGENYFYGEIPHEFGSLPNLEVLGIDQNRLVGVIPDIFFNMSTLMEFSLHHNTLSGNLPSSLDLIGLPNLEFLNLGNNNFSGGIPGLLFNSSKLSILELGENSFSGFIPETFGSLSNLKWLSLAQNFFTSSTPELRFLSSLGNCTNLRVIALQENPLNGVLPSHTGLYLSTSLQVIVMYDCKIRGMIPEDLGNLTNLTTLGFANNKLSGSIPETLGRLQTLQGLDLQNNELDGPIPHELCYLVSLYELHLNDNKISGSIPACLGDLNSLRLLYLSSNQLSSIVPSTVWNLRDILRFDFSSNSLNGSVPLEIGNLKVVVEVNLSRNYFSGVIPTTIGGLKNLQLLSLEYNKFKSPIPESFGGLTSLELLDVSNNNLYGVIPSSLEKLIYLRNLNLSFNNLEGEVPNGGSFANLSAESFMGNDLLCGSPRLHFLPCKPTPHKKSRIKAILLRAILPSSILFIIAAVLLAHRLGLIAGCQRRIRKTRAPNAEPAGASPLAVWKRFSYLELSRATEQFSESNLIGRGSFGSVYKGCFADGTVAAIKVFHCQYERAMKSFYDECEVLTSIRHRNLVKIISSCVNEDFKALILEYMPNGSLEDCLNGDGINLDFFQRLSIMLDVALALEYLHFGQSNQIVHCDIKPNNILLDENMTAHLSDFGIAKLLSEEESMRQTLTLATIGYMAPEYGREGKISAEGDVYSYGITLMEIFTGMKPTNEFFSEETSLRQWVNESLAKSVMNVVDRSLLNEEDRHFPEKELWVSSVMSLALECTRESPNQRINAREIVSKLKKIREEALSVHVGRIAKH